MTTGATGNILLVEDDEGTRGLFEAALTSAGYTVHPVRTGAGALMRLRNEPFDLVVLDLMLPGISGPEVLDAMRDRHGTASTDVPVIVVTGATVSQRDLGNLSVVTVLRKPLDPDDLVDAVYLALQARPH
jgi:CheY-like chemotaxis protein